MTLAELMQFAETETGCSVSIETPHPVFSVRPSLMPGPEQRLHHSRFCRGKKMKEDFSVCRANKARSLEIARLGRAFTGTCPRGWRESAFPFLFRGDLAAVLYFGSENEPDAETRKQIHACARFLLEFLRIEFELAARENDLGNGGDEHAFPRREMVLHYLELKYGGPASLKELADKLGMHAGYLGMRIRESFGKTFRELLTEKRIEAAKVYLKLHRNLSVGRVSALCGFSDSNYFSVVFRKKTSVSPGVWRARETDSPQKINLPGSKR